MARKVFHVILIISLLTSAHLGMAAPNWVTDFTNNINREVMSLTKNLETQINYTIQQTLAEVNKTLENLPRDGQGRLITNGQVTTGGNFINVKSVNGVSMTQTINSGYKNGEPYVLVVKERNDGNYLYHDETSYYPKTNATERIHWRLDLTNSDAEPEFFPNEQ
ncbi:PREDICTED: uncharacterized protein LOC105617054 [Atta cephalotes]|uniref:Uncharacterized protein n=1 Tax=Atta cephalotes TaxID=12957 RepID=A0A158N915_ATTCE|nr:PREDICTED: uncharacterized protein LOC105617054 [Atta cephalotes]